MDATDDAMIAAALQGGGDEAAVCRAAGVTAAEFRAARDAFLRRRAAAGESRIAAAVTGPVEIVRDGAGVPHVFAGDSADLYFGLGVAMAQDRLWQMDRLRRRALGLQAEVLGAAYLPSDIAHRTVGIPAIAAREAGAVDPATARLVDAMVAGINRQIEAFGDALPVEFLVLDDTPALFTRTDVIAIGRGIWWSLNGRIDRISAAEAARLLPEPWRAAYLTPEASENTVLPGGPVARGDGSRAVGTDDATGSNNWALAGGRTASGQPILAGDPHQPFWVPSSWYEYALHGPEDDVAGAGHPGFPGLWWGMTGRTAWSITNNAASTRDLYVETVDPNAPDRYRDGGAWREFETRTETIPVRGGAAHALTVRGTVRGPVVNDLLTPIAADGDPPLSLRWVGAGHLDDLRAGIALPRARDWTQFRAALRDWSVAVFNFVFADAAGTIGYQMAGRIPRRGRVVPGFRDASDPADAWEGFIAFDDLPHAENPPGGHLASANQRIVPPDYPQPIYGAYSQGHRGVRLAEALADPAPADRETTIRLQNDVHACRAARMVPPILAVLDGATGDAALLRDALADWNLAYAVDSAAPTLFENFLERWQRAVLGHVLPARLIPLCIQQTGLAIALLERPEQSFFPDGTPARARAVAGETVAALRARLGDDPAGWHWGRVHVAHWRHPLSGTALGDAGDIGPAPVDGGSHTLRNTGGDLAPNAAGAGTEYRMVVDFSTPDRFLAVQNVGNSGVPGSPHYRDQFEAWREGGYHTVRLDPSAVRAARTGGTLIEPGRT